MPEQEKRVSKNFEACSECRKESSGRSWVRVIGAVVRVGVWILMAMEHCG